MFLSCHGQRDASAVVQRLVDFSADPQMMQQYRQLSSRRDDRSFLATLPATFGQLQEREDYIKDLQDKTNKWKSGNVSDVKVATFGANTAVSHYKFTYDAELRGKHRARTVICSDTWVNDSGTWKTAATHCSMVEGSGK
jgi:hypothetical protein